MPTKCCWVIHGSLTSERKASTSPSSFTNHSTLLLNRVLKRQAPCLYIHFEARALDRLSTERVDALGLRAVEVIICMITRDSACYQWRHRRLSLSTTHESHCRTILYYIGSASYIYLSPWGKLKTFRPRFVDQPFLFRSAKNRLCHRLWCFITNLNSTEQGVFFRHFPSPKWSWAPENRCQFLYFSTFKLRNCGQRWPNSLKGVLGFWLLSADFDLKLHSFPLCHLQTFLAPRRAVQRHSIVRRSFMDTIQCVTTTEREVRCACSKPKERAQSG